MFKPKNYQRETLEWLRRYLGRSSSSGVRAGVLLIPIRATQTRKPNATPYRLIAGFRRRALCMFTPTHRRR